MIRDKLIFSSHEVFHTNDKQTRPLRLLVEEPILTKLEEQKLQLSTISVKVLDLSGRASTRLKIADISTIEQLISCSENTLLNIPHVGITIVEEIKNKLNLYLSGELNKNESVFSKHNLSNYENQINHSSSLKDTPQSLPIILTRLIRKIRHPRK